LYTTFSTCRHHQCPLRPGKWKLPLSLLRCVRPITLWIVISWPENTDDNNNYYCHYNGVRGREVVLTFPKLRYTWLQQSTQDVIIIIKKIRHRIELMISTVSSPPRQWFVAKRQHILTWILTTVFVNTFLSLRPRF